MTAREWYVVIGLAKTGTTVVATAVLRARGIARFCLEPESAAEIEALAASDRLVIKIIFDIWMQRSDALTRLCGGPHVTTIATVRDPRDELVSRLHYLAYDYFSKRETTPDDREDWIDIFRRKEEAPERIGLLDMREQILARFGRGFGPLPELHESYADFLDELAGAVHLLRYEDFVRGTVGEPALERLLAGAHDVGPQLRRVHRSGASGAWNSFFTERDVAVFNERFKPFIERFGYPLERRAGTAPPSPATGSDYVARLIEEARALYLSRRREASVP